MGRQTVSPPTIDLATPPEIDLALKLDFRLPRNGVAFRTSPDQVATVPNHLQAQEEEEAAPWTCPQVGPVEVWAYGANPL